LETELLAALGTDFGTGGDGEQPIDQSSDQSPKPIGQSFFMDRDLALSNILMTPRMERVLAVDRLRVGSLKCDLTILRAALISVCGG
jgi:hypothetical protein